MMSSPPEQLIAALAGLLLLSLSLFWLLPLAWRGMTSRRWPTTTGRITRSEIQRPPDQQFRRDAQVALGYEYRVNGISYAGTVLYFGDFLERNGRAAYWKAARYPVGATVTVYYHPQRPEIATLEPRPSLLLLVFVLFGLGMIMAILYSFLL